MLSHLTDAELLELDGMLKVAEKAGGWGSRLQLNEQHSYDTKYAYHIVRLVSEVEQILTEHDLDLERNREQLKSIRRGEWTLDQIETWFEEKERDLEATYLSSTLPHKPDEAKIKELLMNCLEIHYGDISAGAVRRDTNVDDLLREMQVVLDRYGAAR